MLVPKTKNKTELPAKPVVPSADCKVITKTVTAADEWTTAVKTKPSNISKNGLVIDTMKFLIDSLELIKFIILD